MMPEIRWANLGPPQIRFHSGPAVLDMGGGGCFQGGCRAVKPSSGPNGPKFTLFVNEALVRGHLDPVLVVCAFGLGAEP